MSQGGHTLLTRDPVSGDELVVTRLECPSSGVSIEGRFSLGWLGALTPEQIDFVGLLLRHRNNLQRLANELGVAYNTARSRLDEVVDAVGGSPEPADEPPPSSVDRQAVLDRLAAGEIAAEEAIRLIEGREASS